ncbi:MAG: hypothetical protein KGH96_20560, partial [Sphingomonadales bacterium]|nr:hypothetical protein [Sphingomonadales bacterium]
MAVGLFHADARNYSALRRWASRRPSAQPFKKLPDGGDDCIWLIELDEMAGSGHDGVATRRRKGGQAIMALPPCRIGLRVFLRRQAGQIRAVAARQDDQRQGPEVVAPDSALAVIDRPVAFIG